MMIPMESKVVVITGASRGLGRALAIGFAQCGADLVLNARSINEGLIETQRLALEAGARRVELVGGNVSEKRYAEDCIQTAVEKLGRVDVLINNAGIARDNPLLLMKDSDWHDVIQTNLTGVFECSRAAMRPMMQQRSGRIISISSISAISGRIGQANYAAAKAGVVGLTKSMARELGRYNILVNALLVGLMDTDMTRAVPSAELQKMKAGISLGRFGAPEEIVGPCLFYASDLSSYITGSTLNVSGGSYL